MLMTSHKKKVRKAAKRLGVSKDFIESCPHWVLENRAPTEKEYTQWARGQHKYTCKEYEAAWPISFYQGRCIHRVFWGRACASFFSNSGMCESGQFDPERTKPWSWVDAAKSFRRLERKVKNQLKGGKA